MTALPRFLRRRRAAEKLRAAADLLVTDGWIRGAPADDQGRHCALGALNEVIGDDYLLWLDATGPLSRHVQGTSRSRRGIAYWNDQQGRTAEEVVAALRETADALDPRTGALQMEARPAGELPTPPHPAPTERSTT